MNALWLRRAVRHVVVGLLPLLLVGTAVLVVLTVRLAETSAPVRDATARATATVERTGFGPDGRDLEVSWTDDTGTRRGLDHPGRPRDRRAARCADRGPFPAR